MTSHQPDSVTLSAPSLTDPATGDTVDETSSADLVEAIETVIQSLNQGEGSKVTPEEGGVLWKFQYGSVDVFVQLTGSTDEDRLSVWSPVLKLPARNEGQLTRQLLEANWLSTFEAHFAIFESQIVVLTSRTVADLSPGEISRAITVVATIADDNDESLQAEFGA